MKVRRLIEASTLDPETLHVVFKAFDDAWGEIAPHFDGHGEQARLRLAHAVLIVVREDSQDAERLKNDALQVMALAYRDRLGESLSLDAHSDGRLADRHRDKSRRHKKAAEHGGGSAAECLRDA